MNEKLIKQEWPESEDALDKINFDIKPFMRIWWYYEDEVELYNDEGIEDLNPKHNPQHSGVVVPKDGISSVGSLDIDKANVIVDTYPTDKNRCFYVYTSLSFLLDRSDIVEIIDINSDEIHGDRSVVLFT